MSPPPLPQKGGKSQWRGIFCLLPIHLVCLLIVGISSWKALDSWANPRGDSDVGLRFGDSVYWIPVTPMSGGEMVAMAVFWSYPIWLALAAYGAWRFLRRGRSLLATLIWLLPLPVMAAGFVGFMIEFGRTRADGERFYEECQARHPGVHGIIVVRGENGETADAAIGGGKREVPFKPIPRE